MPRARLFSRGRGREDSNKRPAAAAVAAGLIYRDRYLLLLLYPFLAAPIMLAQSAALESLFPLKMASRFAELAFFWVVALRTLRAAGCQTPKRSRFLSPLLFLAIGFGFWFAELSIGQLFLQPQFRVSALFSGVLLFLVSYVFFFYFMPLLTGAPLSAASMAAGTRADRLAPLKATVGPFAVMFLTTAVLELPYPDGREVVLSYLSAAASQIYPVLSAYLSLAFGLLLLPESDWRDAGLDPYKMERLQTLALPQPRYVAKTLSPDMGAKLLMLGILLGVANASRLVSLPPSPKLELGRVSVGSEVIRIELKAQDPRFKFRSFQPLAFNISGEKGAPVVPKPEKATIAGLQDDVRVIFPHLEGPLTLELVFIPKRAVAEILQLEDLYLWYRGHRLMHLDLKGVGAKRDQ